MIKERLVLASRGAAVKIIGLFLLSDILHNSGAPIKQASNYRTLIQNLLPEAIESIAAVFRGTLGRMSAFQVRPPPSLLISLFLHLSLSFFI
jgi:U2-associated protein SR140